MTTPPNDEAARRAYWTEQMDLGYAMVEKLIAFPVNECGERFASIADAAAAAGVEMMLLEMSERTPMRSPFVEPAAIASRLAITAMMEAHGFMHFPFEFWHFNKGDAGGHILTGNPQPCRYGPVNWNPQTNEVVPVADPMSLLNPLPVIEREIAAAIQRAADKVSN